MKYVALRKGHEKSKKSCEFDFLIYHRVVTGSGQRVRIHYLASNRKHCKYCVQIVALHTRKS